MKEKELITKIESLKGVRPGKEWVSLTRADILGEKKTFLSTYSEFVGSFKIPAFAATVTMVLFGGIFIYSQLLISTNQRMVEEVQRLAKQNEVEILSIALANLKDAKIEMQRDFAESMVTKSEKEVIKIAKDIAPSLIEIREKEEVIMGSLGVMIEPDDLSADRDVAFFLITDLEKRSLTDEDGALLEEAREYFDSGKYQKALKKVLEIGDEETEEDN